MDIFGLALSDFFQNKPAEALWLHNNYGEKEEMPVDVFFRKEDEIPELETIALNLCRGKILDIGAGVGSHALILQKNDFDVTALELSAKACQIMKDRGVQNIVNQNVFNFNTEKYDTLLLLMNGIGLSKTLAGLTEFFQVANNLLNPNGQVIFDSSDISYLYQDMHIPEDRYFGEISYQYEYRGEMGDWFHWLYIDQILLAQLANKHGWNCVILYEDDMDQYLAQITRKN